MKRWVVVTAGPIALGVCGSLWPSVAAARSTGSETDSCISCHTTMSSVSATLTPSPLDFAPGDTVDFTLTLTSANISNAGYYIAANVGMFTPDSGGRQGAVGPSILHNAPVMAQGGSATIHFKWQAPAEPGGVDISVFAVAGNNDRRNTGDTAFRETFNFAYGCEGVLLYQDLDRDNVGSSDYGVSFRCEAEPGWAALDGDCTENNAEIYPGAPELCNKKDDDCDGEIDEGIEIITVYQDADGDGFGTTDSRETRAGCDDTAGVATFGGDCDDTNPLIFPDSPERCNELDDNCDGRTDEGVRTRCGVGLCERVSNSCVTDNCVPGTPTPELCNQLDDDCDGEVDETPESLCPNGELCVAGSCGDSPPVASVTASAAAASTTVPSATMLTSSGAPTASSAPLPGSTATAMPAPSTSAATPVSSSPSESQPASGTCSVRHTQNRGDASAALAGFGMLLWMRRKLRVQR